uniref:Tyrosinase copper-binding domain-containing protein n=1 Tax=Globodera rostochiensis TaxID=31243 RepID=A0A914HH90_GLORO
MMGLSTKIKFCLLTELIISTIIGQHRRHVVGGTYADNGTTSTAGTPPPLAVVIDVGDLLAVNLTVCDRFGRELRRACKMRLQFWLEARKAEREGRLLPATELPPPSPGLGMPTFRKPTPAEKAAQPPPSVVSELYACFNTSCLSTYMPGFDSPRSGPCSYGRRWRRGLDGSSKTILAKCERMEYRMLSDNQRARFHAALLQLKNGFGSYEYDRISFLHSNARMMPCAHGAPTFVLWHREFLKR